MSIRQKTVATLAITLVALVGVLYVVLSGVINAGFGAVEQRDATLNVQRVQEAWTAPLQNLAEKLGDWGAWDDTYRFILDRNPAYVEANLTGSTLTGMKIDLMLFIGADGRPVRVMAYDRAADREVAPPRDVIDAHFAPGSANLQFAGLDEVHKGVLFTPGREPLLFAAMPITDSEGEAPSRGTLVFGAWFGAERRELMSRLTRLRLTFHEDGAADLPADFVVASAGLASEGPIVLTRASDDLLAGYTRFCDAYGRKSLIARAEIPREIHRQAGLTLRWLLLALVTVALAFSGVIMGLLERLVLRRVTRLSAGVGLVTTTFDFSSRMDTRGSDEIATLATSVNGLIAAVEQVVYSSLQDELAEARAALPPPAPAERPAEPEPVGQEV